MAPNCDETRLLTTDASASMLPAWLSFHEKAAYAFGSAIVAALTLLSFWLGVLGGILIAGLWRWLELRAIKRLASARPRHQARISQAPVRNVDHLRNLRNGGSTAYSKDALQAAATTGADYLALITVGGRHGAGISIIAPDSSDTRVARLAWGCQHAANVLQEAHEHARHEQRRAQAKARALQAPAGSISDSSLIHPESAQEHDDDQELYCDQVDDGERYDLDGVECIVCGVQPADPNDTLGWCSSCTGRHEAATDGRANCDGCGELALTPIEALLCTCCARSACDKKAFLSNWKQLIRTAVRAGWDEAGADAGQNDVGGTYAAGARRASMIMARHLYRALHDGRNMGTPIELAIRPSP